MAAGGMAESEATRVIAIRHGETAWNAERRIQGQLDVGLNDAGRAQAERVGRAVAHEGIDAIYSSDLLRALQTSQQVAAHAPSALPIGVDAGLRERHFGEFEGHAYADIDARWPAGALRWRQRDPSYGPAGGETLAAFYDRCIAAAARLAARHPGQTIALVAHGGVMDCLYRAALGLDLRAARTWALGNASINRLLYADDRFALVGWSDTQHLDGLPADEGADGYLHPAPAVQGATPAPADR